MNIVAILFLLPALAYALASWGAVRGWLLKRLQWLLALALVLHAGTAVLPWSGEVFHYGFAKLLSLTLWVGVFVLWVDTFDTRSERLMRLVLPAACVACLMPLFFPGAQFRLDDDRPLFLPHLVAGTLAYGVMFLAAMHGLLMSVADRRLHRHKALRADEKDSPWMRLLVPAEGEMPPLMSLERTLFRFIGIGFVFLLLTTLTGVIFSEETFGRPLRIEHKTVFSLIATLIFGLLLVGRQVWGWRGRTALRLAGWGFAVLLLSYVGSRFVLEVLLHRV